MTLGFKGFSMGSQDATSTTDVAPAGRWSQMCCVPFHLMAICLTAIGVHCCLSFSWQFP